MRYARFLLEEWKQSGRWDEAEELFGVKRNLIKHLGEETIVQLISEAIVKIGKIKQMTIDESEDALRDKLPHDFDENYLKFLSLVVSRMF